MVGDAERLPFQSGSMDAYTIAFGIRNVTYIDAALAEAHRVRNRCSHDIWCPVSQLDYGTGVTVHGMQVLKKGGAFHCLEFSRMAVPGLRELYDSYSFNVIPQIGR